MMHRFQQQPFACEQAERVDFFQMQSVPVHCNVLWQSREEALSAPAAPIRLAYFPASGLIYNVAFDERLTHYQATYENALHFSPRFREYAGGLAARLIDRYDMHCRHVIEVGCGDGHFLAMLCDAGTNRGVGFDPSYNTRHGIRSEEGTMHVIAEPYGAQHAHMPVDLLVCRHVLEHIADPRTFLGNLRRNLANHADVVVYFEVPNALYTLRDMGVWDIIYEHCSYFTPNALRMLFEQSGFEVLDVIESYGGQFLGIEACLATTAASQDDLEDSDTRRLVERFAEHYSSRLSAWRAKLEELGRRGKRAMVWGGGSKGVTFLNALASPNDAIEYVVDINPRKEGRYVPCTAQRVVHPRDLCGLAPDCIILMNSLYHEEVAQTLADQGVRAEILPA